MFGYKFIKEDFLTELNDKLVKANSEIENKEKVINEMLSEHDELVKRNKILDTLVKNLTEKVNSLETTAVVTEESVKPKTRRRKVTKKTKTDE